MDSRHRWAELCAPCVSCECKREASGAYEFAYADDSADDATVLEPSVDRKRNYAESEDSARLLASLTGGFEEADRGGGRGVEGGNLPAGRNPHDQIAAHLGEVTEAPLLAPDDQD